MQFHRRAVIGVLLASTFATAALAQARPIKIIVPFPAGGGTDLFARTIGQKLSDTNKWTVVIDNKPGAGGNLGVDFVAKAPADGYTLVLGQTSNLAINPTLYSKLPYDPVKDLAPVALVASAPLLVVVAADSPYKTLADILAASKAKPGSVTFGSPGNGTASHLAGEMLQKAAGVQFQHIPYKGAAQALTDVMSGQVNIYVGSVPTLIGHVKNGKLRAIAVTSPKRTQEIPQTPTIAESGFKGFEAVTWFGFVAPAGTPAAIIKTLNTEINKALANKDVAAKLESEGGDVMGGTPEQFSALLKKDIARWGQVVRDSGAKID
ncbi:Bug family tripartite tricarboxylate transporter substrate binding protein [Caenimonas koreensis]|uniref:Bug family tripartite tricarboxylate transporter substrate binding protein n=1 Tax=Caenimonas koreensis TaxID=367474 RepID=UPI003784609C